VLKLGCVCEQAGERSGLFFFFFFFFFFAVTIPICLVVLVLGYHEIS